MQVYITKIIDPSSDPVFRVEVSETQKIAIVRAEAREAIPLDWEEIKSTTNLTIVAATETGAEYEIAEMHVVGE